MFVKFTKISPQAFIMSSEQKGYVPASKDFLSFKMNFRLIRAKSAEDKKIFSSLFVSSFTNGFQSKMKNPDSILSKVNLKIARSIRTVLHSILANLSKVEVVKTDEGRIVGGFCFSNMKNKMHIWEMVLDPDLQNKRKGLELLFKMAERIKNIAIDSGTKQITCDVCKNQNNLIKLYGRLGFIRDLGFVTPAFYRLNVKTDDFASRLALVKKQC